MKAIGAFKRDCRRRDVLLAIRPPRPKAGGGLMVAAIQLSIALGSTLGGLAFDHTGWQSTFALSSGLLIVAAGLTILTSRQTHH